jgi:hypothetical protein
MQMLSSLARKVMVAGGFLLVFAAVACPALAQDIHPPDVPEIDPGSAMSGISLLAGGMLLLAGKLRKKK